MNYRAFVKKQLMGGKLYKVRGFGIGAGSRPSMQLNNYHGAGTISHRAVVGPLIPDFGSLSIATTRQKSGAGRIRKIYDDEKTGKGKKFNSLKFNF